MLHAIKALFAKPIYALVSRNNVIIITAYVNKGVVTVSHKGKVRRGLFSDNTLKNIVKRRDFEKNAISFMSITAQLLDQVTKE
jgi:hypothetical protein